MSKVDDAAKLHSALGHPIRKNLIEYLDKKGEAGFKELKDDLGVTVGTLYYHIEILDDLVTQNTKRKYMLTDKGKAAKKLLESGAEVQSVGSLTAKEQRTPQTVIKQLFLAPRLFKAISEKPLRFAPEALMILAASGYLYYQAKVEPTLLLYITQPTSATLTFVLIEVVANWLGLFALAEIACYLLYKRLGGESALLIGTPFLLLPTLILPMTISAAGPALRLDNASFTLFFLPLQAWSFLLLTALIAVVKGLPVEKSAVITLILVFANLALYTRYLP